MDLLVGFRLEDWSANGGGVIGPRVTLRLTLECDNNLIAMYWARNSSYSISEVQWRRRDSNYNPDGSRDMRLDQSGWEGVGDVMGLDPLTGTLWAGDIVPLFSAAYERICRHVVDFEDGFTQNLDPLLIDVQSCSFTHRLPTSFKLPSEV